MARILIGLLACLALLLGFMLHSLRQNRVIRLQRNRMQEVLSNIEEGILRFGKDFKIEAEYSPHLLHILEARATVTGQDIFQLLFQHTDLTEDTQQTIRAALSNILEEGELAWSLNSNQLPSELHRHKRDLNLLWQPHYDGNRQIDKMLLVIRDVTSSKVLEAEVHSSRLASQTMTHHLQEMLQANSRSLGRFMNELLQELRKLRDQMSKPDQTAPALRRLHTVKGNARSLGLLDLAEAVHRLESTHRLQLPDDRDWEHLLNMSRQYDKLFHEVFRGKIAVPASLLNIVDEIFPALLQQLARAEVPFGSIVVKDEIGFWSPQLLEPLRIFLLHGLANAVDHGYVLAKADFAAAAALSIEALRGSNSLRIVIRDEGIGISWEKLQALALKKNFRPGINRPLTDLLFLDGLSTSAQLSLSSGRGVGLAAVKDACHDLGADVTLLDNDRGRGTMLVVTIPDRESAVLTA